MSSIRVRSDTGGFASPISAANRSMYSSLANAGQPWYSRRHADFGLSHTAKVSAKSSVGCAWAYQAPRCCTNRRLPGRGR